MKINELPHSFLNNMKEILKEDFQYFYSYLEKNEYRKSVTLNYKANKKDFVKQNLKGFEKVTLTEFGYYIPKDFRIGKSLLNHAGIIYSQDSSAMLPVELLNVEKGDNVLDLCSAPGGKSIQILNKMQGNGVLVSNEIIRSRASILYENLTKMGYNNFVITNSTSEDFKNSNLIFDKILVDAPCSGEGLFAKSDELIDWSEKYIIPNATRQLSILENIKNCLKVGGTLVYSTCTFNLEENEKVVANFLKNNPNFELVEPPIKFKNNLTPGFKIDSFETEKTLRCYPHKCGGSGQFVAVIRKISGTENLEKPVKFKSNLNQKEKKIVQDFLNQHLNLNESIIDKCFKINDNIYIASSTMQNLDNIKVLCNGTVLGELRKDIIKPNHSLFKGFAEYFKLKIELNESDAKKYVFGEQIELKENLKGYGVFTYLGFPLGGFKANGDIANNLYPKNLRN